MKKKLISLFSILILLLMLVTTPVSADFAYDDEFDDRYDAKEVSAIMASTSVFELQSKSTVLMDATTGSVLLENNSNEKFPIASVTKIMSMLLVMEAIDSGAMKMEDMVEVSEHAFDMGGSQVYLEPGEQFPVNEMLKAVAIHSANDAIVALAEKVAGSEEAFVGKMNEKAKQLGMKNSNFLDCSGLTDEGHYSTAYDIALMSRELIIKHPYILKFTSIWQDKFRNGEFGLDNTNKLIYYYKGCDGLKTGYTKKAGYCLSATAKKNDMRIISVVLGEPDSNTRFAESRKLLDYAFSNYEVSEADKKDVLVQTTKVKKGIETNLNGVFEDNVKLLLQKGEKGKVTKEVAINENIVAPVKKGQKIGTVTYKVNGKEITTANVVAQKEIKKANFFIIFTNMIKKWLGMGK